MEEKPNSEKTAERGSTEIIKTAQRIVTNLRLSDASMRAAIAAVEERTRQTRLSLDGIVQEICDEANHAARRGIEQHDFLGDFLARTSARSILETLNLPVTNNSVSRVAAVVKAEAKDASLPLEEAANRITQAASEDRRKGTRIDIFYFEDVRWRSNARVSKAEQRKLDNLEVNARVQQRLREKFGSS